MLSYLEINPNQHIVVRYVQPYVNTIAPAIDAYPLPSPSHPDHILVPIPADIPAPFANARFNPDTQEYEVYLDQDKKQAMCVTTYQNIRELRNQRLRDTDWTMCEDAPVTPEQKEAWRAYRKALRDFPATCDPLNVVWPEAPQ